MTNAQTADFSGSSHSLGGTLRRVASTLSALRRGKGGTAAVEFALAAPVLLGLLVPVADLGIAYAEKNQVEQAAQAGAQYAAFHPWNTNSPTDIANAVRAASTLPAVAATPAPIQLCGCPNGTAVTAASCTSTCSTGESAGYYVVVNAEMPYTPKLPYSVLGNSVTLTAQSTIRIR
jgi:Flp pilus assembly protein TadG